MKNKKLILIVAGIVGIMVIILILFLIPKKGTKPADKTKEPDFLLNTTLPKSDDIKISTEIEQVPNLTDSASIYYAEDVTNLSQVEEFIKNLGYDYEVNKAVAENHLTWGNESSEAFFSYSIKSNVLDVSIRSGIGALIKLNRNNAESVVSNYLNGLGMDYEYKLSKITSTSEYYMVYLNRMIDKYPIETDNQYGYTDYLMFSNNGALIYAQLLFAKFTNKLNYKVPLIDVKNLLTVINDTEYPKKIRIDDLDFLDTPSINKTEYMEGPFDDSTSSVIETVKDCNPTDISLVYYYPKVLGVYILPTYKLSCISTAKYMGTEYSVSSIVYTNAVSPEYISAE